MKVWSKTLTPGDLRAAAEQVNVEFPGCSVDLSGTTWGPQAPTLYEGPRTRRLDGVHLRSHTGTYHANSGTNGAMQGKMAASWTEWGWFLARVFERDPDARCGDYRDADDFHAKTNGRFIDPRTPRERQIKRALKEVS